MHLNRLPVMVHMDLWFIPNNKMKSTTQDKVRIVLVVPERRFWIVNNPWLSMMELEENLIYSGNRNQDATTLPNMKFKPSPHGKILTLTNGFYNATNQLNKINHQKTKTFYIVLGCLTKQSQAERWVSRFF